MAFRWTRVKQRLLKIKIIDLPKAFLFHALSRSPARSCCQFYYIEHWKLIDPRNITKNALNKYFMNFRHFCQIKWLIWSTDDPKIQKKVQNVLEFFLGSYCTVVILELYNIRSPSEDFFCWIRIPGKTLPYSSSTRTCWGGRGTLRARYSSSMAGVAHSALTDSWP